MKVIDYYGPHSADFYKCVAASGVKGIARYLTNGYADPREITQAEIAAAHDAGLEIHFVYEMNATFQGYFTYAQGAEDCRQAMNRLAELGAPDKTVVYFAVDVNIEPSSVTEYFNGVGSVAGPSIVPGIYGYQRMCEYARTNYPAMGKHLWQTYGSPTGALDLWQNLQETLCGVEVDVNDAFVNGWMDDMTDDRVRALIQDYLANVYGPALETELAQRSNDGVAAAVKAVADKLNK